MAEAALMLEREVSNQEYAHSLDTIYRLGRIAVEGVPEKPSEEQLYNLARDDFTTGIDEMLKTDVEFRNYLDVESVHKYQVIDGQVCANDGTPMVEVIENGLRNAQAKARLDSRMHHQVIRDQGDLLNAQKVDQLKPGMARFAVSMDPKRQLEEDSKYWNSLGYRQGIAYLQWYCRADDETLIAGAYSVDLSDENTWRELFGELGVAVASDESPNTWIQNGFEAELNVDQTRQWAVNIRERYYQKRQAAKKRYSVTEYTQNQAVLLDQMFNAYYPSLSEAVYTRRNNRVLQNLAQEMLARSADMKPQVRRELVRIANSNQFDDDAGRLIDSMIRYAAVEELRKGLKGLITDDGRLSALCRPALEPELMNRLMAANVQTGTKAGRRYGGCARQADFSDKSGDNDPDAIQNPQDAFGGSDAEPGEISENGACVYEHENCYCCQYNDDGSERETKLKVRARRNKYGVATCLRQGCGAWLSSDGKKGYIGGIAEKAEALRKKNVGKL